MRNNIAYIKCFLLFFLVITSTSCEKKLCACNDTEAANFEDAIFNQDKKCEYRICSNPLAENYDELTDNPVESDSCVMISDSFIFDGEFDNNSGVPSFVIGDIGEGIISITQTNEDITVDGGRLTIPIKNVSLKKDGRNHEINTIVVNELRDGTWDPDPSSPAKFVETTVIDIVILIQRGPNESESTFDKIITFAQILLDKFSSNANITYNIAVVHYGDEVNVVEENAPFIELSSNTITSIKESIRAITYGGTGNPLGDAIVESAEILSDFQSNANYKSIFILGDGEFDGGRTINETIAYLGNTGIKDIFCIGVYDIDDIPENWENNFTKLSDLGSGHYEPVNLEGKLDKVYDKYYMEIPNVYTLTYERSNVPPSAPVQFQWILTGVSKP